ncbi:MAG: redoxin domain-containing protein [Acidimicrobiia bacterium]|nr:redoxin domain-containing protein [Acidimicrobiia bacterium]
MPATRSGRLATGLLIGLFVAVTAILVLVFDTSAPETVTLEERAPAFEVDLLGGGTFSLQRHQANDGRPLVVNLWASWCVPCREEIPDLSVFAMKNPGIAVVGVAVQDQLEPARELIDELRPAYPTAFDEGPFRDAYQTFGLPATIIIDSNGIVQEIVDGQVNTTTLVDLTREIE